MARPSLQATCGKRSSLATKGQIKVETIVKEKYRVSQKNALSDLPSISRKIVNSRSSDQLVVGNVGKSESAFFGTPCTFLSLLPLL